MEVGYRQNNGKKVMRQSEEAKSMSYSFSSIKVSFLINILRMSLPKKSNFYSVEQNNRDKFGCDCFCGRTAFSCYGRMRFMIPGVNKQCRSCELYRKCLSCSRQLTDSSESITCSICLRKMDLLCYQFPLELLDMLKKFFAKICPKLKDESRTVCRQCQKKWPGSKVILSLVLNGKRYCLNKIKHPSPLHYAWKVEEIAEKQESERDIQKAIQKQSNLEIVNIFMFWASPSFIANKLMEDVLSLVKQQKHGKNEQQKIYFLVKWNGEDGLAWEEGKIIFAFPQVVDNFFNLLNINLIRSLRCSPLILKKQIRQILNVNGSRRKLKMIQLDNEDLSWSTRQKMKRIYELYQKKMKQSIKTKIKDENIISEVVGRLINTIYFQDNEIAPVLFLTDQEKMQGWKFQLKMICPFHIVLMLRGEQIFMENIVENCFFQGNQFSFNILVLGCQTLKFLSKSVKQIQLITSIDFSLLIIDTTMSSFVKDFASLFKTAKIRLEHQEKDEDTILSDFRVGNVSSLSSLKDKNSEIQLIQSSLNPIPNGKHPSPSNINFNFNVQELMNEGLQEKPSEKFALIKNTLNCYWSDLDFNAKYKSLSHNELLDEVQRVIVLRCIMAFGMNYGSLGQFVNKIKYFQRLFFEKWDKSTGEMILYTYTKYFLAVVKVHANSQLSSNSKLLQYYLFDIKAEEVLKRIALLDRLKKYYDRKIYESKQKNPKILKKSGQGKQNLQYLDLMILEGILERGFGRWQSISEYTKAWQPETVPSSFREFICHKVPFPQLSIEIFASFINRRASNIVEALSVF